jgi:hypothetical protein
MTVGLRPPRPLAVSWTELMVGIERAKPPMQDGFCNRIHIFSGYFYAKIYTTQTGDSNLNSNAA